MDFNWVGLSFEVNYATLAARVHYAVLFHSPANCTENHSLQILQSLGFLYTPQIIMKKGCEMMPVVLCREGLNVL